MNGYVLQPEDSSSDSFGETRWLGIPTTAFLNGEMHKNRGLTKSHLQKTEHRTEMISCFFYDLSFICG